MFGLILTLSLFLVGQGPEGNFVVVTVNATDADSGKNAEIVYSLSRPFKGITVDPNTGAVTVNRSAMEMLDGKGLELVLVAEDMGTPPLRDVVPLTLYFTDDRGVTPHFTQEEYQ